MATRHSAINSLLAVANFALCSLAVASPQDDAGPAALRLFESKIRPILEKHCLECHSGEKAKGELNLSDRNGWQHAGVIKPGDPNNSLLMSVIRSDDPDVRMPPPGKTPLSQPEAQAILEWIAQGAYDPRSENSSTAESLGPKKRNRIFEITDQDRAYWAFQPLRILSESEQIIGSDPSKQIDLLVGDHRLDFASPRERIRRLYLDLWGLPPSFEQVQAFEADPTQERFNTIVEELLGSHHYAERWGRYWLDWVRFAETNGYERDGLKPHAWRYRDYVIESFAKDKPYNQFIIEQLAGDQWADSQSYSPTNHPQAWRESIIATGFYRLHVWDDEPDDTLAAEYDDADDVMVTIGSAFLGLTVGCARCHDHKFDPISQQDYYSLLSFMRGIDPYGQSKKEVGAEEPEKSNAIWFRTRNRLPGRLSVKPKSSTNKKNSRPPPILQRDLQSRERSKSCEIRSLHSMRRWLFGNQLRNPSPLLFCIAATRTLPSSKSIHKYLRFCNRCLWPMTSRRIDGIDCDWPGGSPTIETH
jgi:mono/diheme cytochrome c family protein